MAGSGGLEAGDSSQDILHTNGGVGGQRDGQKLEDVHVDRRTQTPVALRRGAHLTSEEVSEVEEAIVVSLQQWNKATQPVHLRHILHSVLPVRVVLVLWWWWW